MASKNHVWFRYGSAAAAAALVFVLLFVLRRYFEDRTFTVIYVPVVVYAAFAGGRGPAIFATILCIVISAVFLGRDLFTNPANLIDVVFFGILGPILGFMGDRLLRGAEESRHRQAQLQSILDTVPEAMIVIDDHALLQHDGGTIVRLVGQRSDREKRLDTDADALPARA